MSTAYILGRPEWGQPDDDAAEEYAASICPTNGEKEAAEEHAASLRGEWAAASAYYWAAAYVSLTERDFRSMRENARIATDADQQASPEGVLLAAIFGGCEKRPADRPVKIGRSLPGEQVAAARAAVKAEMARHAKAESQAAATRLAAARSERAATEEQIAKARSDDVACKLSVGKTYVASLPYRLGKKSSGLCWVEGVLVAVPGVNDGASVRITALRAGRSYGLKYEAEGELS